MERRRLMFMGLASALTATLGLAAGTTTAQAAVLGDISGLGRGTVPMGNAEPLVAGEEDRDGSNIQLVQRHRRNSRCHMRTRTVRYRDRRGRIRHRQVQERVCR